MRSVFLDALHEGVERLRSFPIFTERAIQTFSLGLVTLLAVYLRFLNLSALGFANHYYAAAVTSMLQSWHNFFFVAAEPGGLVSVDKPPLGLWIQAISAHFLGVNTLGLLLPELLAGIFSVLLIYFLVNRVYGFAAGLIAALALAVTPIVVATDRNNTIDSLLIFTLLLAAWAFIRATETGRLRYLLLGGLMVGLGFNIKMLQAYLPLPAFLALYFFGASEGFWIKIRNLSYTALVLVIVSFSWATIVQLTPASQRPYVGSSGDNSIFSLIFGYNGINRLMGGGGLPGSMNGGFGSNNSKGVNPSNNPNGTGGQGGPGGMGPGQGMQGGTPMDSTSDGNTPENLEDTFPDGMPGGGFPGSLDDSGQNGPSGSGPSGMDPLTMAETTPGSILQPQDGTSFPDFQSTPDSSGGLGRGGDRNQDDTQSAIPNGQPGSGRTGASNNGRGQMAGGGGQNAGSNSKSILRLLTTPLSKEIGWFLPFSLISVVVLAVASRWQWPFSFDHQYLVLWGGWLLTGFAFFSVAGFFHEYYLATLAPAVAAMTGIGIAKLWHLRKKFPWAAAGTLLLAVGSTLAVQFNAMTAYVDSIPWKWLILCAFGFGLLWLCVDLILHIPGAGRTAYGCLISTMIISPICWSYLSSLNSSSNQSLPAAYSGKSSGPSNGGDAQVNDELLSFLEANTKDMKYLMAVPSSMQGADYILATGRPVLYLGGFKGSDEVVDADQLAKLVSDGELRYIYWGTEGRGGNVNNDISTWVTENCTSISGYETQTQNSGAPDGTSSGTGVNGDFLVSLYDCGGAAQ